MTSHLNRFQTRVAALALACVLLAGLGGAAYGLTKSSASASRHAPGVAVVHARGQGAMLAMRVLVSHRSVALGGTVKFGVQIIRLCRPVRLCGRLNSYKANRVWIRVVAPVPTGVTWRLTKPVTRARTTILVLGARMTARPGTYKLRLDAGTSSQPGRGKVASTLVTLTVNAGTGASFRIAGSPSGVLVPGGGAAGIDLVLSNLRRTRSVVSGVSVSVAQVQAPHADAANPCTPADFAVTQLLGSYRLTLAPSNTRTLAQLGVDPGRWPTITMLDRPLNQDGCEGASLVLSYTGTAGG